MRIFSCTCYKCRMGLLQYLFSANFVVALLPAASVCIPLHDGDVTDIGEPERAPSR